jgi:hypothetical protein
VPLPRLLQVERDLQVVTELGLNLVQTINTHCHAGESGVQHT